MSVLIQAAVFRRPHQPSDGDRVTSEEVLNVKEEAETGRGSGNELSTTPY
jgi:hypothetical protein